MVCSMDCGSYICKFGHNSSHRIGVLSRHYRDTGDSDRSCRRSPFCRLWGFIIGGVASSPFGGFFISKYSPPVSSLGEVTVVALVAFVIVFGTILSFGLYMSGLQRLSATETGIAASLEPIMAAVAAYFFLKVQLTILQYLGGALILLAVVLIASSPQQRGDVIPQI